MRRAMVAGSGKMGRDVGVFLASHGWQVMWLSRDPGRLARLEAWAHRKMRPAGGASLVQFALQGAGRLPQADLLLECVEEAPAAKREVLGMLEGEAGADSILASSSSSLLPDALHSRCVGLHPFYPLEMTRMAEIVLPCGACRDAAAVLSEWLRQAGVHCIEQDGRTAFALNRILLPIQAESMMALMDGWPPALVDGASRSTLLATGQISLMDSVGLDVVLPAVRAYRARMSEASSVLYEPLERGLETAAGAGKRGRKNADGLGCGAPLPWTGQERPAGCSAPEAGPFVYLFVNTCLRATQSGLVGRTDLDEALRAVFGAEVSIDRFVEEQGALRIGAALDDLARRTGRSYFRPAAALRADPGGSGEAGIPV